MRDQRYHLIHLEATADTVERLSRELREWLRAEGWTVAADGLSDWLGPRDATVPADRYGPRMEQLARSLGAATHEDHLTVHDTRRMYDGSAAMEGIDCPACGQRWGFDDGVLLDAGDTWWRTRVAPDLTCPACGATAPMDRWGLDAGLAVGTLAITLALDDAHDEFRSALRERFPGRWAGIYQHI